MRLPKFLSHRGDASSSAEPGLEVASSGFQLSRIRLRAGAVAGVALLAVGCASIEEKYVEHIEGIAPAENTEVQLVTIEPERCGEAVSGSSNRDDLTERIEESLSRRVFDRTNDPQYRAATVAIAKFDDYDPEPWLAEARGLIAESTQGPALVSVSHALESQRDMYEYENVPREDLLYPCNMPGVAVGIPGVGSYEFWPEYGDVTYSLGLAEPFTSDLGISSEVAVMINLPEVLKAEIRYAQEQGVIEPLEVAGPLPHTRDYTVVDMPVPEVGVKGRFSCLEVVTTSRDDDTLQNCFPSSIAESLQPKETILRAANHGGELPELPIIHGALATVYDFPLEEREYQVFCDGDSGLPLIDDRGRVIAIMSGRMLANEEALSGSNTLPTNRASYDYMQRVKLVPRSSSWPFGSSPKALERLALQGGEEPGDKCSPHGRAISPLGEEWFSRLP
jgi:hypothetical protein